MAERLNDLTGSEKERQRAWMSRFPQRAPSGKAAA